MTITAGTDEGQDCAVIRTESATYFYQLAAGGFSSICDADGVDWIGFHPGEPRVPGGAADVFRGLPNLVHPQGFGHPGFSGCTTSVSDDIPQLRSSSLDGRWQWEVSVTEEYAELAVTRAPEETPYWFLYEGIPGGRYDPPETFWGSPAGRFTTSEFSDTEITRSIPAPAPQWTYFGHRQSSRVLTCARCNPGGEEGVLYFMSSDGSGLLAPEGMVVFGMGRGQGVTSQLRGTNRFQFGFIESTNHEEISVIAGERLATGALTG